MRSIFTFSAVLALIVVASAKPPAIKVVNPKNPNTTKAAAAAAATPTGAPGIGGVASVEDANHWCMFMPPKPGGDISLNEVDAVPFCTQPMVNAPTAQIFPEGFITAVHFVKTPTYVQVTGLLNITKYNLSPNDQGGQYDMKAPVGALCHGYSSFVNLIEPSTFDFCIRCCNDNNCPVGRSSAGCYRIVEGVYNPQTPPYSVVLDPGSTTSKSPNSTIASAYSSSSSSPSSSSALAPFFTTGVNGENIVANNSSLPAASSTSAPTGTVVILNNNGAGSLAVPASVAAVAMFAAVVALL